MLLDINTDAVKAHVQRLREINRSALPVAVRQTLTKAARDVKEVTMPAESNVFIHRKPTFLKANSKFVQAQGFDINTMQATVGFIPKSDARDSSVADLEEQENGGEISGRSFIPLSGDRVGNSWGGNVKSAGRWRVVNNKVRDSKTSKATNKAGAFKSTAKWAGVGGLVIGNIVNDKGNRMVWRVDSLGKNMKLKLLFALKPDRKVEPPATRFMRKASLKSADKMNRYFIALAGARINRIR